MSIAVMNKRDRCKIGIGKWENRILYILNILGYLNIKASVWEDMVEKIDCLFRRNTLPTEMAESINGFKKEITTDVKVRDKGPGFDSIKDVREPYYGLRDPRTEIGRDMRADCGLYVFSKIDSGFITFINGNSINNAANRLAEEYAKSGIELYNEEGETKFFHSKYMKDCMLCFMIDHENGRPKLLSFIPQDFFTQIGNARDVSEFNLRIDENSPIIKKVYFFK